VINKEEGKNNYKDVFYDCADVVVSSLQQCEEELFIRSLNNTSFGINQLVVFAGILSVLITFKDSKLTRQIQG